jgi:tetratricopeptide (TPR) repeat protein
MAMRTTEDMMIKRLMVAMLMVATGVHASRADVSTGFWRDPEFQKQFMGSYGFRTEVEPRVTAVEFQEMEKVLMLMTNDLNKAAEKLVAIIAAHKESNAIYHFTLANIYFQQDKLDPAAEQYQLSIKLFPSFLRAHKNLGMIHARNQRFAETIKSLTRVVELGGGDGLTYGLLGFAYSSTEDYVSAESAYRLALMLQPSSLDWKMGLARAIYKQEKYPETIALTNELIGKYPDKIDFWLLQANAFIGMNQPLRAAQNFEILDRMGQATADSLNTLGDIYVNDNQLDLAARAYARAFEADATRKAARPIRAAEILVARGGLTQARLVMAQLKTLRTEPMEEADRMKLLKIEARLAVAEGQGGDAANVLEEIVKLDPLDGEALILLGQHCARTNEPERAIFYYERAASLERFEAEAKVRHAQVLVSQSRYQDALPLLRRAQEVKPRDDVGRYLEQVERVARSR